MDEDEQNIVDNLSQTHKEFLENLSLFMRFGDIMIVHGGVQNHMNLDDLAKKDYQKILRMRYLDQDGNYLTLGQENENSLFWADVYDGNQGFVVYGHQWFKEAKIDKFAIGVDTGCVYGNKLSAVIFKDNNFYIESCICK